jgi:MSHA biogenesis protein MshL
MTESILLFACQESGLRSRVGSGLTGIVLLCCIAGCGTLPVARVDGHLKTETRDAGKPDAASKGNVPQTVRQVPLPPPPQARIDEVRYSITVKDVLVEDLLFAISRDTKVNIDVHPGIEGRVTLNAIDQTLRQILTRVAKQVDMRYEMDGPNLVVMKDSPYLKLYRVDYVNMTRDSTASIGVQTQVVGPSTGLTGTTNSSGGQNTTQLRIDNASKNRFWESLEKNIKDMLRDTDKLLPEGSSETFVKDQSQGLSATNRSQTTAQRSTANRSNTRSNNRTETTGPGVAESQVESQSTTQTLTFREAASVIVNAETGTIFVRATLRQQEKVAEFIAQVTGSASRQVLIEATVVEVTLNDNYQSGVDWSALGLKGLGYSFTQNFTSPTFPASPITGTQQFGIQYNNPNAAVGGAIKSSIKLLDTFGNTKVLSSPRITTLNNQTAVMKVVENRVYFTVTSTPGTVASASTPGTRDTYTSTPNVVPEGFVMNVTPQISEGDIVTLSIRPSITKITGFAVDPNPAFFPQAGTTQTNPQNLIPQIQTREFETVLRVPSGQTAVLGGLMLDSFDEQRSGLPILSRWKLIGDAVSSRNDTGKKTELVIFLRPIVIKDASVETDFAEYRRLLPDAKFFKEAEPLIPGIYPASPADRSNGDSTPRKAP